MKSSLKQNINQKLNGVLYCIQQKKMEVSRDNMKGKTNNKENKKTDQYLPSTITKDIVIMR